jgi:hypothetical protein
MIRTALALVAALLIAVQVVRVALVDSLAATAPDASRWTDHPEVQLSSGMIAIASAARVGRPVAPAVFERIYDASRKAPLKVEPFLVRGVQAQLAGNGALARQAFAQAKWRDPHSLPARYFLAEHYLRQRDAKRGLTEIAQLARLVPGGTVTLAPYVARYAGDPANRRQLAELFRAEPELEDSALSILAGDARNADLVLQLSNPARRGAGSAWLPHLLGGLTRDFQYTRARRTWAELSGVRLKPDELIYDPAFRDTRAPAPFNWSLVSSSAGLAERQRGGGLHVIYYGQQDGVLASQLLILRPGTYRLATAASGADRAGALRWVLTCASTNAQIASIPLDQAVAAGWQFSVPASCSAQRLDLTGSISDSSQQVDLTIRGVTLAPRPTDG